MNIINLGRTVAVILVAILMLDDSASAQSRIMAFSVSKLPQPGNTTTYSLFVGQFGAELNGIPLSGVSVIAPNGTVLPARSTTEFSNFTDLSSMLFGDWITTEHPTTGPDNQYTTHVNAFSLSNVYTAVPVMTFPEPGATVPPVFIVKWNSPGNPSNRGLSWDAPNLTIPLGSTEFGVDGFYSAQFHTQLLQPPPVDFTVRSYVQTVLPDPTITNRTASLNGATILSFLNFDSKSLPLTLQVVPEPNAFVLAVGGLVLSLCIFGSSRRCPD